MNKKYFAKIICLFFGLGFLFITFKSIRAFGISSPYVYNDRLARASHYEKEIIITRTNPEEDLKAKFEVDVPGADNWFSFDKGKEFILPKGESKIPVTIKVDVPKNAKISDYKGKIRITTSPLQFKEGAITISLGGQVDVDLNVVKEGILDFKIWSVNTRDLEEGEKIQLLMNVENIGNIKASLTKVHFDIYDSEEKTILESVDNFNKLEKIKPFQFKEIIAEMPNQLTPGSYWAIFKIFKGEEIINSGKVHLSLLPKGTLPKKPIKFFEKSLAGMKTWLWLIILIVVIILGIACFILISKIKRRKN